MARWRLLQCGCFLLVAASGCSMSLSAGARRIFSRAISCPADRITVKDRPDLAPHKVLDLRVATPPPDVATDPARLAIWRDSQERIAAARDSDAATFEVEGCGTKLYFVCDHPTAAQFFAGGDPETGRVDAATGDEEAPRAVRCREGPGDVYARIASNDAFRLSSHSAIPPLPERVRGLRVRLHVEMASAAVEADKCRSVYGSILQGIGWVIVQGAGEPYDVVVDGPCFNGWYTTANDVMFALYPSDLRGAQIQSPDGQLIDTLPATPKTMICPTFDESTCTEAIVELYEAACAREVAASPKLAAYLEEHPSSRAHATTTP